MKHLDSPIPSSKEDKLNRAQLAKRVFESIKNYNRADSFVLGICGKWGDGKTSFINMILENSDKANKNLLVINFNPWYFSGKDEIFLQFFNSLEMNIDKLSSTVKSLKNTSEKLKKLSHAIKPLLNLAGLTFGIPNIGNTIDSAANQANDIFNTLKNDEDILQLKSNIEKDLQNSNYKILVIIDDLDRLYDDEICEILRLIKSVGDFSNTFYILSYDKKHLSNAIKKVLNDNSEKYLDKIIQMEITISTPQDKLVSNFSYENIRQLLSNAPNTQNKEFDTLWHQGLHNCYTNIREIKKFLNIYEFIYYGIVDEINQLDIIVLLTLYIQCPKTYNFILENGRTYLGHEPVKDKSEQDIWKNYIKDVGKNNWQTLALNHLFPTTSNCNFNYELSLTKLVSDCRLCTKEHFDKYFHFSTLPNKITEIAFNKVIFNKNKDEILKIFNDYKEINQLSDYIEGLNSRKYKFSSENIEIHTIISALLEISDQITNEFDSENILSPNLYAINLSFNLLDFVDNHYKKQMLIDLVNNRNLLSIICLLDRIFDIHGFTETNSERYRLTDDEKYLSVSDFEALKVKISTNLESISLSDLAKANNFIRALYALDTWKLKDSIQMIKEEITKIDQSFLMICQLCLTKGIPETLFNLETFKFLSGSDDYDENMILNDLDQYEQNNPTVTAIKAAIKATLLTK